MHNLPDIHLKPEILARYGLPDIPYPVPLSDLQAALSQGGELPLVVMLRALQQRSAEDGVAWQQLEPAMDRLAQLLAPDDERPFTPVMGDDWWLELGAVDMAGELVTLQRAGVLVAAISGREDGRLQVAVFRPLDAKSAECLISLSQLPHPEHGVCMRENNWQYALDCSATSGNHYAAERGDAYLSCWKQGLGIRWDGSVVPDWYAQRGLAARRAAVVATEMGVYYTG